MCAWIRFFYLLIDLSLGAAVASLLTGCSQSAYEEKEEQRDGMVWWVGRGDRALRDRRSVSGRA